MGGLTASPSSGAASLYRSRAGSFSAAMKTAAIHRLPIGIGRSSFRSGQGWFVGIRSPEIGLRTG
jgi:hypothetical protein